MKCFSSGSIRITMFFLLACLALCCTPEAKHPVAPEEPSDGVHLDLNDLPYGKLSTYQFFSGALKEQMPNARVLPYSLSSSLFTDYALKKRFVYIPKGHKATYRADDQVLEFPVGTALIKSFYYDQVQPGNATRLLETRVMVRKPEGWIFANYVWNDAQSEALLDMSGSNVPIQWINKAGELLQTNYRIPSETECLTCHKHEEQPIPIGPKPQNMLLDMAYDDGSYHQLLKWIAVGYLEDNLPATIEATIDYTDATQPLAERVRSYLDINCAHCHQEGSHCDYRPLRLAFSETSSLSNLGVCIVPDESVGATYKYIVWPTRPDNSVLYYRLSATDENIRMPLLGRTMVHQEAVALLQEWIDGLDPCN